MKLILFLAVTLFSDVAVSQRWDGVGPGVQGRGRGGEGRGRNRPGGTERRSRLCGTSPCASGMRCVEEQQRCSTPPCQAAQVCLSSQSRKGTCPKKLPHIELMRREGLKCVKVCEVDSQCMDGRKCCSYGCKRLCRKPVEHVKDGQCPVTNTLSPDIRCRNLTDCRGDGDCFWKKKCCRTKRCGKKCIMAEFPNMKPGRCPLSTLARMSQVDQRCPADACTNDIDCPADQKCCGRCPRECIAPMRSIREGTCPQSVTNAMSEPMSICTTPDQCTVDSECSLGQRCCGRCPQQCTHPVPPPPAAFQCPRNSIYDTSMHCVLLTSCLVDTDCKAREKCCLTPCGLSCIIEPQVEPQVNNLPAFGQPIINTPPVSSKPGTGVVSVDGVSPVNPNFPVSSEPQVNNMPFGGNPQGNTGYQW